MDINLVPEIVINVVDKFKSKNLHVNEKFNLKIRLESIRDFVSSALRQAEEEEFLESVTRDKNKKKSHK